MFLTSSAKLIDAQLSIYVDKIEEQTPGLSILAARQFRYKIYQTPVEISVTEPRKFNVLEEFVLRASIELAPPPTQEELASVLGLDPVFVRNTTANLKALKTIEVAPGSPITLTPQGREFYEKGSVPQEPELKQIYAIADPLMQNIIFLFSPLDSAKIELPNLEDFIPINNISYENFSLTLEDIQQQVQDSGLGVHVPEEGKIITNATTGKTQQIWQNISLFVLFDVLEDKITFQVRRGKQILEKASTWFQELALQGKISLDELCDLSDEAIALERESILEEKNQKIEARLNKIRQEALKTIKKSREKRTNLPTDGIIIVRDRQIQQDFIDTLNLAESNLLIYSPWISEEVVDEPFLELLQKLADRGVWILIGYGIARKQEDETKPISPQVEAKLPEIKTPEGLPAVQIFWLGNSHAKEAIVDRKVYLCGSQHGLSYRGETVYKVTLSDRVQEAYEFLADRFQFHAQKLWDEAVLKKDSTLAIQPLCVWGALGMEDKALNQVQDNNWLELLPFWLKVVCQGLKSKKISPDSAYFKIALSLLNQISAEDSYIEALREGWQQVIGAIAFHNSNTGLALLNDEVWEQFLRLGIAPSPIDSPAQFISKYTSQQPSKKLFNKTLSKKQLKKK